MGVFQKKIRAHSVFKRTSTISASYEIDDVGGGAREVISDLKVTWSLLSKGGRGRHLQNDRLTFQRINRVSNALVHAK